MFLARNQRGGGQEGALLLEECWECLERILEWEELEHHRQVPVSHAVLASLH